MTAYHERQGELTARILARVDLAGMSIADRVDLMTALSELSALAPPSAPAGMVMPSMAVRHPACVPPKHGVCAASAIEEGLSHCCAADQDHDGQHGCSCGHTWNEVRAQHADGACGLARQMEDAGHKCVCRLAVHNLIAGPDMVDRPLHACVHCGGSWAA